MAGTNLLARNPIVIVTPMTSSFKSAVATTLGSLFTLQVAKVEWSNAVTAGDFVRVIDPGSGEALLELKNLAANSNYFVDFSPRPRIWRDFRVSQIDSGTLYIFTV